MTATTRWIVPEDHPAFAGHFPGRPILPGVVLLDVVLQSITNSRGVNLDPCEIGLVKFLSPAQPGEALEIRHEDLASGAIRFEVIAGLRKVASGSITLALKP